MDTQASSIDSAADKLTVSNEDPALKLNLKGHRKTVTDISFNPCNNEQFVTSSEDHSLMIWNINDNIRSYNFVGHSGPVASVAFSPNGGLVASASVDKTVRLWVPTIKGLSTQIKAHSSAVLTVAFSPDGSKLVTGSNDKSVKLWDVATNLFWCSFVGHNHWIRSAKFSPDGKVVVSCADDRTIRVWDVLSGKLINIFHNNKASCNHLALHRDGTSLAAAMNSGTVRVYDMKAKKLQQHYTLHDATTCVDWHPTANYLITSGRDGDIRIVDVMEGRPIYTLSAHDDILNCVKFSTTGERFASAGVDKHILVWDTNFIQVDK